MAFETNAQRRTDAPVKDRGFVEAAGFINVVLTLPGQQALKLPSMALQGDPTKHGALVEWLNADPTRIAKIAPYLTLDYKANVKTAKVLDFSKIA